jgi:outer membrane protein assembly factor BamB/predicted Ser/Thr protein kinase
MANSDTTTNQPGGHADSGHEIVPPLDSAAELASILDRFMADLQAGRAVDRRQLCAAHPELAGQLDACLAGIEFINRATGPATETPATLGEFRIIRELGRGGMGVVYEAEQTTLRRHVALKVLRFGVVADEDAMNRFRREAETVARLHHTNIVPIFAVGCEGGVHYYAMQFIEGRSLAEVLAESQRTGAPISSDDVAYWGLQAAEALAHAHQRGVIHRDIKPSNLLLDPDGVVWLTDFGLAKRMDEATLTVHGTLMGTPRYMSPEQAASLQQPVDRRTDLYSLGATLFELATGRPVFESAMPHLVIAQILTEEPARPRQIRPALPVDIETVILTCLAKDPPKRYQSAQALASDLRAVLEARPIQARRAPWGERVMRYVRQRKKSLTGAGLATAATVLIMLGALGAWRYYTDWRIGRVVLTTEGPSLSAQLLNEAGDEPIGEPFSIGARSTLALPAGDYRLRVQTPGVMGQTYRLALKRGETGTFHLTLADDRLLARENLPVGRVVAVELTAGKADFIEWTGETLIRRDGSTGSPIWDSAHPKRPWGAGHDPADRLRGVSKISEQILPGAIVLPAPDLNGDGTGDLVWPIPGPPSFLALSGKDGSLLWADGARAGLLLPKSDAKAPHLARIMGTPAMADVDGDGSTDLIAEFAVFDDPKGLVAQVDLTDRGGVGNQIVIDGQRVVVAVSGRSGKELWNYAVDPKPTAMQPDAFDNGIQYVPGPNGPVVVVVAGSTWIGLDPATGRLRRPPIEFGFEPVQPIQHVDLDGDGTIEILALEPSKFEPLTDPTLVALSMATGERAWTNKPMPFYRPMPRVRVRDWPLVADLDGDGGCEVVVPHLDRLGWQGGSSGGIRMLDGRTGQPRWDCPLYPGMKYTYDSLIHLLGTPDLDADGVRDLIVVSRYTGRLPNETFVEKVREPSRIYVDAVSGKNGQKLWHWRTDLNHEDTTPVGPPFWWGRGPDGWPMLALAIGDGEATGTVAKNPYFTADPPVVHVLAVASGREAHVIEGLWRPSTADFDGDGLADLWGAVGGKVRVFRTLAPEAWRTLGGFQPAGDLDGDGVSDVVSNDFEPERTASQSASGTAIARSGRDGRVLWQAPLDPWENQLFGGDWIYRYQIKPLKLPAGDLDGDGAPEILVHRGTAAGGRRNRAYTSLNLQALSGRTGRTLWSGGALPHLVPGALGNPFLDAVDAAACDNQDQPDVFVRHHILIQPASVGPGPTALDEHARLARLSGRDGRVIWDVLLTDQRGGMRRRMGFDHEFADLDGDGSPEMVLWLKSNAGASAPFEFRALTLATGETRWSHPINPGAVGTATFMAGDLDGDGTAEVVVCEQPLVLAEPVTELTALDGAGGRARWIWRSSAIRAVSDQKPKLCLADFEGRGRREVCVSFAIAPDRRRIEILDSNGRSRVGRDLESTDLPTLINVDLDGNGRDELLVHRAGRLCALRPDLTELWSWPSREPIREVLPAAPGQPATVVLGSSQCLDGATGKPRWLIDPGRSILSANDGKSSPRVLTGPDGTTVCQAAMPASAEGTHSPAQGVPARPALPGDDPRWQRPLPWVGPVEPYEHPLVLLALGATMTNLCIPAAILWLATRKRFWSMRLLLALPVVVAIILTGYQAMSSLMLDRPQLTVPPGLGALFGVIVIPMVGIPIVAYTTAFVLSLVRVRWLKWLLALPVVAAILVAISSALSFLMPESRQPAGSPSRSVLVEIIMLSMSGLPIVVYAAVLGSALVRRAWPKAARVVARALLAAILIGAITLLLDMLLKPRIEHYDWSGWHQAGYLGAYAAGALVLVARPARAAGRFVLRLVRRRSAPISAL